MIVCTDTIYSIIIYTYVHKYIKLYTFILNGILFCTHVLAKDDTKLQFIFISFIYFYLFYFFQGILFMYLLFFLFHLFIFFLIYSIINNEHKKYTINTFMKFNLCIFFSSLYPSFIYVLVQIFMCEKWHRNVNKHIHYIRISFTYECMYVYV